MKTIKQQNKQNEKTEVYCSTYKIESEWIPFNQILSIIDVAEVDKLDSGRGGELLRATYNMFPGKVIDVKCSKTNLKGRLYWSWAMKEIIGRIEWEDGVIKKY